MNDLRSGSGREPDPRRASEALDRDFQALRNTTAQDMPDLGTTLRAARRRTAHESREGFSMVLNVFKQRPALAMAAAVVVVAVGLLMVPISYERTVGYDVALSLDGSNVPQSQVKDIAKSFKETMGVEGAMVEAAMNDGKLDFVLRASADHDVRPAAGAFVKQLEALGYAASVETTPRRETVAGNVYAYAMGRVIEISTDGKSASQLESEIRSRLAAAGITNAQVSVTESDGHREVKVNADQTLSAGDPHAEEMPELVLTKNGQPLAGGLGVKVKMLKDGSGATTMVVNVTHDGRSFDVEIPNPDALGDAGIASTIQSRLLAEGIHADVQVNGGEVTVTLR